MNSLENMFLLEQTSRNYANTNITNTTNTTKSPISTASVPVGNMIPPFPAGTYITQCVPTETHNNYENINNSENLRQLFSFEEKFNFNEAVNNNNFENFRQLYLFNKNLFFLKLKYQNISDEILIKLIDCIVDDSMLNFKFLTDIMIIYGISDNNINNDNERLYNGLNKYIKNSSNGKKIINKEYNNETLIHYFIKNSLNIDDYLSFVDFTLVDNNGMNYLVYSIDYKPYFEKLLKQFFTNSDKLISNVLNTKDNNEDILLFNIIKANKIINHDLLIKIIKYTDLTIKDYINNNALMLSVDYYNDYMYEILFKYKDSFDLNQANIYGYTLLMKLLKKNKFDYIDTLMQQPDIDFKIYNNINQNFLLQVFKYKYKNNNHMYIKNDDRINLLIIKLLTVLTTNELNNIDNFGDSIFSLLYKNNDILIWNKILSMPNIKFSNNNLKELIEYEEKNKDLIDTTNIPGISGISQSNNQLYYKSLEEQKLSDQFGSKNQQLIYESLEEQKQSENIFSYFINSIKNRPEIKNNDDDDDDYGYGYDYDMIIIHKKFITAIIKIFCPSRKIFYPSGKIN